MNAKDLTRLKDAFNTWAQNAPNEPVIISGNDLLTPKDIARAVEAETGAGKDMIEMFDSLLSSGRVTMDDVVARLTRKPPQP